MKNPFLRFIPGNPRCRPALLLAIFAGCWVSNGSALTLVKNGTPGAVLVVPDERTLVPYFAAREFQHHVQMAAGAELPIVSETEAAKVPGGKVYFGKTRALGKAGLGGEDFGKYGYAGRLKGGSLYFYGRDTDLPIPSDFAAEEFLEKQGGSNLCWKKSIGTVLAAYEFMESELGARWIWPGPTGEYVPGTGAIAVEKYDRQGAPRYLSYWMLLNQNEISQRQWLLRHRFLRLEPDGFITDHSFGEYWSDYHETHPDIFAMRPNGSRGLLPGQPGEFVAMCVSNPELVRLKIERWKKTGQKDENGKPMNVLDGDIIQGFICVQENDVDGYCICPACRAMDASDPRFATHEYWGKGVVRPFGEGGRYLRGGPNDPPMPEPPVTDRYMKFYLAVQKEAEKLRPGVVVHGQAYVNYDDPPKETKLNEHVIVNFAGVPWQFWRKEDTEKTLANWDGWRKAGAGLFLRPNTTFRGHNFPDFYARQLGEVVSHTAKNGMVGGVWCALFGQWAVQGPNFYMIGRISRNPDLTPDQVLGEFYSAFGPAREQVKAYFDFWDRTTNSVTKEQEQQFRDTIKANRLGNCGEMPLLMSYVFTPEVMAQGRQLMEKVKVAAAGDAGVEARVRILDLGLRGAELTLGTFDAYKNVSRKDKASQKQFLAAAVRLEEFRKAHRDDYLNFDGGQIGTEENGIWGDVLRRIKADSAIKEMVRAPQ